MPLLAEAGEIRRGFGRTKSSSCARVNRRYYTAMKFFLAIFAYLVISFLLGWGVLLCFKGNPWLLIVTFLGYAIVFAKAGCLPGKASH
jgi:F0F1-type ATP synthase assembly protein I